jgi:hypothetical protein
MDFGPDGKMLGTVTLVGGLLIWDTFVCKPIGALTASYPGEPDSVWFSDDGSRIAVWESRSGLGRVFRVPRPLPDEPNWISAYLTATTGFSADRMGAPLPVTDIGLNNAWRAVLESPDYLDHRRLERAADTRMWHINKAIADEDRPSAFATAFHLRWLAKNEPDNSDWKARLSEFERKLKTHDK